jgi:photosystem II stability/assembly factor-like uncharacterized protein
LLYVGTDDGHVWITQNDGVQWNKIESELPLYKHVAKIIASKFIESRVYLVLNDRRSDKKETMIYKSDDFGKTWQLISEGIPQAPANVMIEDLDSPETIWCGTDMGVYKSLDGGKHWFCMNGNLPTSVSVSDMFIHPRDKKLVLSTYGRGIYFLKQ